MSNNTNQNQGSFSDLLKKFSQMTQIKPKQIINSTVLCLDHSKQYVIFDTYSKAENKVSIKEASENIALESSIGTWAEVSTEKQYMKKISTLANTCHSQEACLPAGMGLFPMGVKKIQWFAKLITRF